METKVQFGLSTRITSLIAIITLVTLVLVGISLVVLDSQKNDSSVINLAGRQRMLTQKMSKEAMAIKAGVAVEENRANLRKTHDLFDRSLKALIHGSSELQLPPTKDLTILEQMNRVQVIWDKFSPAVLAFTRSSDTDLDQASQKILANNLPLLKEMNKAVGLYEEASRAKVATLRALLIGGGVVAFLVTLLCWVVINRKVVAPIREILSMILGMEHGELDKRLEMSRGDEVGQLAGEMDKFAESLRDEILTAFNRLAEGDFTFAAQGLIKAPLSKANHGLITSMGHVQDASDQITSGARQVSESASSLANGATQQAAALEQISASMTQMNEQTSNNAENAAAANQLMGESRKAAERGNEQMQAMVGAMEEIKDAGQSISNIIKVIDEIAFQTNLLALNAAVEAARAGQHGKGFAVVAEEVRNLAARSAKAAQETTALIEGSVKKTDNGAHIADQTAAALTEIVQGISKVSGLVAEIATASREQSQGIDQVNKGLHQLDDVNQQATSASEKSAAIAEQLSAQAAELQAMLQRFNLGGVVSTGYPAQASLPAPGISEEAMEWPSNE